MGPNALQLIIFFFSVTDAIAVPHLFERQGEGLLGDDWLGTAGAAAADFASEAKNHELLNNLKDFVMPSPQPDPTAGAVEATPLAKGQDLGSRPGAESGQALPGISPDATEGTDRPADIELSVEGAPYVPPTKEDECVVTSQNADHDLTVGSQSLLSVIRSNIESCSNPKILALAIAPLVRSFIQLIASALRSIKAKYLLKIQLFKKL